MARIEETIKVPVTHKDYQLISNSLTQMKFIRSQAWLYCLVNVEFQLKRFDVLINDLSAELLKVDTGNFTIDLKIINSFINSFLDAKKYFEKFGFRVNSMEVSILSSIHNSWLEWFCSVNEAQE